MWPFPNTDIVEEFELIGVGAPAGYGSMPGPGDLRLLQRSVQANLQRPAPVADQADVEPLAGGRVVDAREGRRPACRHRRRHRGKPVVGATTFGDDPNELINGFGLLNQDRNFMWKLQGSYLVPADIVVSSNWIWQAGRPFTRKLNMNRFADGTQPGQGAVTIFLEPRDGSLRMESQNYLNLRTEKRFQFGGTRRATVMLDVINLLNADTPLSLLSEVVTSDNFALANTIFNPRRAMVGLRFEFSSPRFTEWTKRDRAGPASVRG